MVFNDYYKRELISLRIDGADFCKKNPSLSSYLAKEGQDPDVERLLEGFAFLAGKLHQQLDQELPEVAHTLVQLLWPNYTRVIPSYSIIQYEALKDSNKNVLIKRGTEVLSKIKADAVQCKFRTTYDTKIMPIDINSINYFIYGKKSSLELNMKVTNSSTLQDIVFDDLRVYLSGSKFISHDLYLYLVRYIEKIEISIKDENSIDLYTFELDKNSIQPVGFNSMETMASYPANVFDGYILLQEFFCFREKYLFIDIKNLSNISLINKDFLSKSREFSIKINFSKALSYNEIPTKENFLLYCTPIINLFEADAIPIRRSIEQEEFLVLASDLDANHSEVFSVEKVRGWVSKKGVYQDYLPFESFEHSDAENEFYSLRTKLSINGDKTNTYLRFSDISKDDILQNTSSTVSIRILCTNRNVPSSLHLGDICISNAINIPFKNIMLPTISYPPPINGDFLWRIISNMSLNYLSLSDIKSLRIILQTYDFLGAYDVKEKEKTDINLKGLENILYETCEIIDKGLPIRGTHIKLKVNSANFSSLGETYLFVSILNDFFSLYSSINSFHRLTVDVLNEELFEWEPTIGSQLV